MRFRARAFTLVEMIGVLAILAIVLSLVAPNVVRQIQTATATGEDAKLDDIAQALTNAIRATGLIPNPNLDPATTNASGYGWAYLASNYTRLAGSNLTSVFPGTTGDTRRRLYLSTNLAASAQAGGFLNTITNWGATFFPTNAKMYLVSASRPDFALALPTNGAGAQVSGNSYANPEVNSLDGWVKQFSGGKVIAPANIVGADRTNDGEFLHLRTIDLAAIFNETRAAQQKLIEQEDKNLEEIARALVAAIQARGQLPDPDVASTAAGGWVALASSYSSMGQDAFRYSFPAVPTNERRVYLDPSLTAIGLTTPANGWSAAPASPASLFIVSASKQDLGLLCDINGPGASAAVAGQLGWLRSWTKNAGANGQVAATNPAIVSWTNRGEFLHVKTIDLKSLFCRVELFDTASPVTVSVSPSGSGYGAVPSSTNINGTTINFATNTGGGIFATTVIPAQRQNGLSDRTTNSTILSSTPVADPSGISGSLGSVNLTAPGAPQFTIGGGPQIISALSTNFYVIKGTVLQLISPSVGGTTTQTILGDCAFEYYGQSWRQLY